MYTSDTRPARHRAAPPNNRGKGKHTPSHSARGRLLKTTAVYAAVGAFAFVFDKIYALFAHGVASPYMAWMFLFPLLGGCLLFGPLALWAPGVVHHRGWRAGFNLYNAGVATAAVSSLLAGIFEIAGTASPYTVWYFVAGAGMALAGLGLIFLSTRRPASSRRRAGPWPPPNRVKQ